MQCGSEVRVAYIQVKWLVTLLCQFQPAVDWLM